MLYLLVSTILTVTLLFVRGWTISQSFETFFDGQFGIGSYYSLLNAVILFNFYAVLAIVLLRLWSFILNRISDRLTRTTLNSLRVLGRMTIIPFCAIAYLNISVPAFQGTLLGVAALFGAAIGFASTTIVSNIFAGMYLLAMRPFRIRDYILLPNLKLEGRVREVKINYTILDLPTGTMLVIPNNILLSQQIINTRKTRTITMSNGRSETKRVYIYPQIWGVNSDDMHRWSKDAIEMTGKEFENALMEPVSWFVLSRARFDTYYQVNIPVEDSWTLLDLTGDFMIALSRNYDIVKEKHYASQSETS